MSKKISVKDIVKSEYWTQILIKQVLDHRRNVYQIEDQGWKLIHHAVKASNIRLIKFLIWHNRIDFLEDRTRKGFFNGRQTPLMIAAQEKNEKIVQLLIGYGASLYAQDQNNNNSLYKIQKYFNKMVLINLVNLAKKRQSLEYQIASIMNKDISEASINQIEKYLSIYQQFKKIDDLCPYYEKTASRLQDRRNTLLNERNQYKQKVKGLERQINYFISQQNDMRQKDNQRKLLSDLQKAKEYFSLAQQLQNLAFQKLNDHEFDDSRRYLFEAKLKYEKANQLDPQYKIPDIENLFEQIYKKKADVEKSLALINDSDKFLKSGLDSHQKNKQQSYELIKKANNGYKEARNLNEKIVLPNQEKTQKILSLYKQTRREEYQIEYRLHCICAYLSANAYKQKTDFLNVLPWNFLQCKMNEKITQSLQKRIYSEFKAGFLANSCCIEFEGKQIIIVAYSGTKIQQNGDMAANVLSVGDLLHMQYKYADQYYQNVKKITSIYGIQVIHVGHSLGALLAEVTASKYGDKAVTFQSPGSYHLIKQNQAEMYNKIVTYVSTPNFINTSKPHVGIMYQLSIKQVDQKLDSQPEKGFFTKFWEKIKKTSIETMLSPIKSQLAKIPGKDTVQQIIKTDIKYHSIDNIVIDFMEIVRKRKKVIEWPIGPLQWFSYATFMREKKYDKQSIPSDLDFFRQKRSIFYKTRAQQL